jgi:antitoxin FitA
MATLTIRNLPDALYAELKARAAEHRRSLNSEAILAVQRAVAQPSEPDPARLLAALRRGRARLTRVHVTDRDLRTAKARGRS